jgi:tetratricopeptide (TPR) repeat protein
MFMINQPASNPGAPRLPFRQGPAPKHAGKLGLFAWVAIAAGAVAFVLMLAVGSFIIYTGVQYNNATACMEKKDYKGAVSYLTKVASFYKDAPKLKVYAQADDQLEGKQYDSAKTLFSSLGAFRDSATLVKEADYRKAGALLDSSDFDGARALYTSLSADGYKDAKNMITEVDYRFAVSLQDKGDNAALEAFSKLAAYKDSADRLTAVSDIVFKKAVEDYRKHDYAEAGKGFDRITGFNDDVAKYVTLIEAHSITLNDSKKNYDKTKAVYVKLAAIGAFEDAKALSTSDIFLLYKMEGIWLNSSGGTYMTIKYNKSSSCWYLENDVIDGVSYKLENGMFYQMKYSSWMELFSVKFLSESKIELDWMLNGSVLFTVTVTR